MSQIDVIAPAQTVLYANRPDNQFGERMVVALQDAGYRLRLAQADQVPQLSYVIEQELGKRDYTVIVSAGFVKVKRRYSVNEAQQMVQPASSIFILGASGDNITLNDSIFASQQPRALEANNTQTDETQVALVTPIPARKEIVKNELVLEPVAEPELEPVGNIALTSNLLPTTKLNMYQTRQSNF